MQPVKRRWPAALSWLDPSALPPLRWLSTGQPVAVDSVADWLVQAQRLNSAAPTSQQQQLAQQLCPAAEFAHQLLEQWLAADTGTISPEHAWQRAREQALQQQSWYQRHAHWFPRWLRPRSTLEELTQRCLPAHQHALAGSAIGSKGVLALVAVFADATVVPLVERYLQRWWGKRAAQCKALLTMLAWVEQPAAVQSLLSVSEHFRTKGIQHHASELLQALAQRKGCTVEQLADRAVPDMGLDQHRQLSLTYGTRRLSLQLRADLTLVLLDEQWQALERLPPLCADDGQCLPPTRQQERADIATVVLLEQQHDPVQMRQAQQRYKQLQQDIQRTLKQQQARLYQALCAQRRWQFQDWQRYLLQHPIMRALAQRLLWVECLADGRLGRSFRPLDDGSLSDVHGQRVELAEHAVLMLLHSVWLDDEQAAAWRTHLAHSAFVPLFEQLPAHPLRMNAALQERAALTLRGYELESLALRSYALQRGYSPSRADPTQHGWLYRYEKRYPQLQITAVLQFSGHQLPITQHPVQLLDLHFEHYHTAERVRLAALPAVLLAECWQDWARLTR